MSTVDFQTIHLSSSGRAAVRLGLLCVADGALNGPLQLLHCDWLDEPGAEPPGQIEIFSAESGDGDAGEVVHLAQLAHEHAAAAIGQADVRDHQIEAMC